MTSSVRPGQCDIESISITDNRKTKTLSIKEGTSKFKNFIDYIHSIDIFESIERPYILADLMLLDGSSLFEDFNFSGGEEFKVSFKGFGDDSSTTYTLYVTEVNYLKPNENLRSKLVGLRLASKEYLKASSTIVSKSYESGADDIIKDIISNFLSSNKSVKIEGSKFQPKIVIPFLNPFSAIDMIRRRVVSSENKSHSFVFFENQKGYFFKTIENLIKSENSDFGTKTLQFFQKQAVSSNIKGPSSQISDKDAHLLFANYTVKTLSDVSHLLRAGGYKTKIAEYDFTKKKYVSRQFEHSPGGENPLLTDQIKSDFSATETLPLLVPFATYRDVDNNTLNFLYDSLPERIAYSNIFNQQTTFIDVPGNTKVYAGSVVELKVPNYDSVGGEDLNKVSSGKYLVTAVRHSLNIYTDSKYTTHLQLKRFDRGAPSK
jgi:hypothetical protein